jgi:hypothetical protein
MPREGYPPFGLFGIRDHVFSLRGDYRGDHMNRSGRGGRQGNSAIGFGRRRNGDDALPARVK